MCKISEKNAIDIAYVNNFKTEIFRTTYSLLIMFDLVPIFRIIIKIKTGISVKKSLEYIILLLFPLIIF